MEHQLWKEIVTVLDRIDKPGPEPHEKFSAGIIVMVWLWAVLHDRPVSWACLAAAWPVYARRQRLPSPSTMSRRLRSESVRQLLARIEYRVLAPSQPKLLWIVDGKPLVISGCSKDRQAG